jgi:hypothetical protein
MKTWAEGEESHAVLERVGVVPRWKICERRRPESAAPATALRPPPRDGAAPRGGAPSTCRCESTTARVRHRHATPNRPSDRATRGDHRQWRTVRQDPRDAFQDAVGEDVVQRKRLQVHIADVTVARCQGAGAWGECGAVGAVVQAAELGPYEVTAAHRSVAVDRDDGLAGAAGQARRSAVGRTPNCAA